MQKYFIEARQLLALAIPVILAQVAQTAMGFVDTVMAGGYSATDMAAVAIGTSIWLPAILFGHGRYCPAEWFWSPRAYRPSGAPGILAGRLRLHPGNGRAVERRLHYQLNA